MFTQFGKASGRRQGGLLQTRREPLPWVLPQRTCKQAAYLGPAEGGRVGRAQERPCALTPPVVQKEPDTASLSTSLKQKAGWHTGTGTASGPRWLCAHILAPLHTWWLAAVLPGASDSQVLGALVCEMGVISPSGTAEGRGSVRTCLRLALPKRWLCRWQ